MTSSQGTRKQKHKKGGGVDKLLLADLVDKKTLVEVQNSYLAYLQSSAAIIDADGKYLIADIVSPYCKFLNQAVSKKTPSSLKKQDAVPKKYLCHHDCYHLSLKAMKTKRPCTGECHGGITVLAAPVMVNGEALGCINAGVANPPADDKKVKRIARKFNVDYRRLLHAAKRYAPRPDYLFESAKKHIVREAEAIAGACEGKRFEMQVREMTLALEKREEERVLDEAEKYRTLLEHISDGIIVADQKGKITFFNRRAEKMLGYDAKKIRGKDVFSIVPQKYRNGEKKARNNFLKTGSSKSVGKVYEAAALRENGLEVPVEVSLNAFKTADTISFVGVLRDITERKKAENALQEARDFMESVLEASIDGIIIMDGVGNIISVNSAIKKITGMKRKELIGMHISQFAPLSGKERKEIRATLMEEFFERGHVRFEYTWQRENGNTVEMEQISNLVKDEQGNSIAAISIVRDVTERKRAEKDTKEARDFLEKVIENSLDGIIINDPKGNVVSVNASMERMLGFKKKELVGQHISFFTPPDKKSRDRVVAELLPKLFSEGKVAYEASFQRRDGMHINTDLTSALMKDDRGNHIGGVSVIRDITEKKSLERQLLQAQKMETIGTLAGGVAHDFNNILGGILGYASFIKTLIKEKDQIYKYVDTIERSAVRAADLTSQLLSFSRGGKYESRPIDINKKIKETLRILYSSIDKSISIWTKLSPKPLSVEGDPNQIQQVFLNLFVNARDAMPGGGTLQIETKRVYLDEGFCKTHLGARPGQHVYSAISDKGIGMNQETLDRVFEPFFSTKGQGEGTGLGLSVVYGIIKNHGGYINVYSEVGKGSIFKIYLPASSKPVQEEKEETEIYNVKGGETILVIDDEEVIRDLVKEGLEDFGYTVLTAENGHVGLDIYKKRKKEIALVILDLILPKMSGKITYEKLKEINPEITVLLSSGYSQKGQAQELIDQGVQGFIQKPFRLKELAKEIRMLLDRKEEEG